MGRDLIYFKYFNFRLLLMRLVPIKVETVARRIWCNLETLRLNSKEAISVWAVISLFFPGGNSSSKWDDRIKAEVGLLSTAIEAQRSKLSGGINDISGKIFNCASSINYILSLKPPGLNSRPTWVSLGRNTVLQKENEWIPSSLYKNLKSFL